uniref:Beta-defensin-like domain-containing protein n=1 Tax=Pelusios castaneus TaxID=367368 RepID=A0A8C8SE33_9SAUR
MKIIRYFFLCVEFLQAKNSRRRCKYAGGICFSGPCPSNYKFVGICRRRYSCCQR